MEFLGIACKDHPHLLVKIGVDCVSKGYASHEQVAEFLGVSVEYWKRYYANFKEGDVSRIPAALKNSVPTRELRYLTGFTDEQLEIMERAQTVPFLFADDADENNSLLQELGVLVIFGVIISGRHNQFRSFSFRFNR